MLFVPRGARFEVWFSDPCQVVNDAVFEPDAAVSRGGASTDVASRRDPVR